MLRVGTPLNHHRLAQGRIVRILKQNSESINIEILCDQGNKPFARWDLSEVNTLPLPKPEQFSICLFHRPITR